MEAILTRYRSAPFLGQNGSTLYLSQLRAACEALLRALPPDAVAGGHTRMTCDPC